MKWIFSIRVFIMFTWVMLVCSCNQQNTTSRSGGFTSKLGGVPVLIFHDVSYENQDVLNTSPDYFSDILEMIELSGRETVFASNVVELVRRDEPFSNDQLICLSFDDAWTGMRDNVYPLLAEKGMKGTFFVHLTGIEAGRPMRSSWDDLQFLNASGMWEIHSHSLTHQDLSKLNLEQAREELQGSLNRLREHGFQEASIIAYPFGLYTDQIKEMAKESGYTAGFTAGPIPGATRASDLFAIPRTTMCQIYDQDLICRKMMVNISEIRKNLAVYDEHEGHFEGEWTSFDFVEKTGGGTTFGQIGKKYSSTEKPTSSWSIEFEVKDDSGEFLIAIWKPLIYQEKPLSDYSIQWSVLDGSNETIDNGTTTVDKSNRWNTIIKVNLNKGKYKIKIYPDVAKSFAIIDALKIEHIKR